MPALSKSLQVKDNGKKKVKKKGPTVSKLKKECDELAKNVVKARDKNTCQRCGKVVSGSDCHGSHVIPVSAGNKLRWDEQNLKVLCYHCHLNWWHKNPLEATEWFKARFPDRFAYLQANRGMKQFKLNDLIALKEELKNKLSNLK
jgi:5-methylcytosine-specific restriction endonuclease McrA